LLPTAPHRKPVQKVEEERLTRGERTHGHQKPRQILKREDLTLTLVQELPPR